MMYQEVPLSPWLNTAKQTHLWTNQHIFLNFKDKIEIVKLSQSDWGHCEAGFLKKEKKMVARDGAK